MSTGKYWGPAINFPGCTHVSPACLNCYAEKAHMMHYAHGKGKGFFSQPFNVVRPDWSFIEAALKRLDRMPAGQVVFIGNMCDMFHEAVPEGFLIDLFMEVAKRKKHIFLFLTKRAERMREFIRWLDDECQINLMSSFPAEYPHVWLGVTAENDAMWDERVPSLLQTPAAQRWISAEPLLGPLATNFWDLHDNSDNAKIALVIAGGESGPGARPINAAALYDLKNQCLEAGVKFHFKQWGDGRIITSDSTAEIDSNHIHSGQVLDGTDYSRLKPADIWKVIA